ncbi:MAG: nucleotide pyrophosphohydrolase [Nocardioides sp.]
MADDDVNATLRDFVAERDWAQFHSPENLAKSIVIEAAELLECFQWQADPDRANVAAELADVLTYCRLLATKLDLDPDQIVLDKLVTTRAKYPVDKLVARARSMTSFRIEKVRLAKGERRRSRSAIRTTATGPVVYTQRRLRGVRRRVSGCGWQAAPTPRRRQEVPPGRGAGHR